MRTFSDMQSQFRRTRQTQFTSHQDRGEPTKQVERIHSRQNMQNFPLISSNYRLHFVKVDRDSENMVIRKNKSLNFVGEVIGSKLSFKSEEKLQIQALSTQPIMRLSRNQIQNRNNYGFIPTRMDPRFKEIYSQLKQGNKTSSQMQLPVSREQQDIHKLKPKPKTVAFNRIRKSAVKYLKEDNESESNELQDQVFQIMYGNQVPQKNNYMFDEHKFSYIEEDQDDDNYVDL